MSACMSSESWTDPCFVRSARACEAGYAQRDKVSGRSFLPFQVLNFEVLAGKNSCHLPRRPIGPDGVSRTSLHQLSRALWSVSTKISCKPIQFSHLCRARMMAYISCSRGTQFLWDPVNFRDIKAMGTVFLFRRPLLWGTFPFSKIFRCSPHCIF